MGKQPSKAEILENTTILIDWVSSIYGIFWGLWIGLFFTKIWDNLSDGNFISKISSIIPVSYMPYLLPGFAILISVYTYNFVKWLWMMRFIEKGSSSNNRITFEKFPTLYFLGTIIAIILSGIIFGISSIQVGLVLGATIFWPITIIFIVNWDWRGWNFCK